MAFDAHSNFGYSTVAVAPIPALTGLSLTVAAGHGALFTAPCNCTVWPSGVQPISSNAEIIRVTAVVGDVLTIIRAQEGTPARAIVAGDQIANTMTVKTFTDIETSMIQGISAAGGVATASQVVFSNANNVSFGAAGQTITASATFAGGGGVAISAGTQSVSTGTVIFSNSNGVTFGMSNSSVVTASHDGLTSQSNQAFSASGGSSTFQTLSFQNGNGVTFSNNAGAVGASVETNYQTPGAYLTTAMASDRGSDFVQATAAFAGTNASGTINSTGISVSVAAAAGQTVQPVAASAANGSFLFSTVSFSNANGISFSTAAGSAISASYTVPSTAGLISAVNFSAGTTSNNLTQLSFSNGSGVSFGLNGGTLTASVQTNYLTTAMESDAGSRFVNTSAGLNLTNISATFNSNSISLSVAAPSAASINVSAGTTSNNLTQLVFSNANSVSFGLNASTITAQIDVPAAVVLSSYEPFPFFAGANIGIPLVTSQAVVFLLPDAVSASYLRFPVFMSTNSTTRTVTASSMNASVEVYSTWNAVVYKMNTGASSMSLTWVASGSAGWTVQQSMSVATNGTQESYTQAITGAAEGGLTSRSTQYSISNANSYSFTTNQILTEWSGSRWLDINFNNSLEAGNYVLIMGMSTNSATNSTGISVASNCRMFFSNMCQITLANTNFKVMGSTNVLSIAVGGGSFSTVGGGTTDALPLSAISSNASQGRIYFQMIRRA